MFLPYTITMCTTNILSSFCVTVMPLAAFMACKKFIVLFVFLIGICFKVENNFKKLQYICLLFIVIGGIMIG
jgi:hypothetical protein